MTSRTRLRDILLLAACGLGVAFAAIVVCRALHAPPAGLTGVAYAANAACWVFGYRDLARRRGWPDLRKRLAPARASMLLAGAAAALLIIVLISGAEFVIARLGVPLGKSPNFLLPADRRGLWILLLSIVVVAPVAEELMFRGLLLDWLREHLPAGAAIWVGSLVFAALHGISFHSGAGTWLAFADRTLLGVGASVFTLRTGSLRPGIVLHAITNALAVVLALALAVCQG